MLGVPQEGEVSCASSAPLRRHLLFALVLLVAQCVAGWHEAGLFPHPENDSHHCSICMASGALHGAVFSSNITVPVFLSHGFDASFVWREFRAPPLRIFSARAPPVGSNPTLI